MSEPVFDVDELFDDDYLYFYEPRLAGVSDADAEVIWRLLELERGIEILARHPGWAQRAGHLRHHRYTAEQVIVSAHAYGSAKLLHHLKHRGTSAGLSDKLGVWARTNSEQLLSVTLPYGRWKHDPERIHITPGSVAINLASGPIRRRASSLSTTPSAAT